MDADRFVQEGALSTDNNGNDLDNPAKFVKADNYNTFAKNLFE